MDANQLAALRELMELEFVATECVKFIVFMGLVVTLALFTINLPNADAREQVDVYRYWH